MNEKHTFSPAYEAKKRSVLNALASEACAEQPSRRLGRRTFRVLVAAATVSLLAVSTFAAARWIDFSANQEGYQTHIHISLATTESTAVLKAPSETTTAATTLDPAIDPELAALFPKENKPDYVDPEKPLRFWASKSGEVGIKLHFAYLPEDFIDLPGCEGYKWSSSRDDHARGMSVNGIDLRRSAWDETVTKSISCEAFTAGGHEAYLIKGSDATVYNRDLYILFADEEFVVHIKLQYGLTDEEVKAIADGLTIEETTAPERTIPIYNQLISNTPKVYTVERPKVYYDDLFTVGDTATYDNSFHTYTFTLEEVTYYDSFSELDSKYIERKEFVEKFTDESGNLLPYQRTEYIRGDRVNTINHFGETEEMTKKLICITISLECTEERDLRPYLRTYSLYSLAKDAETGEVSSASNKTGYVIDSTPKKWARDNDCIYLEPLGNGRWRMAYLMDTDECGGEFWLRSILNATDYGINFRFQ